MTAAVARPWVHADRIAHQYWLEQRHRVVRRCVVNGTAWEYTQASGWRPAGEQR